VSDPKVHRESLVKVRVWQPRTITVYAIYSTLHTDTRPYIIYKHMYI